MYVVNKKAWRINNLTYFIIKLRFVGISLADRAGLEKNPRWAKIWSKSSQTKTCLDLVILSLHDTILSPSCTVRCPGATESLVFLSSSTSGFVLSLLANVAGMSRKKTSLPGYNGINDSYLKLQQLLEIIIKQINKLYAPAKRKQWL